MDPSGTFITHICPLFPLISICIYVPFGFHWGSNIVTMSVGACEYLCCAFWAFVPLWIEQMITGLVPCVNHCARVYLFEVLLALLFGFQPCVLYTCLFGLRALTRHTVIWGLIKLLRIPAPVSRIIVTNVIVFSVLRYNPHKCHGTQPLPQCDLRQRR